ncbi:hypothetical protein O3M35_003328 [Rhynocoris fuscipes]|uniref:Brinker DNA-binding domain-containing protein n=1 Tax=Rhynocoris fuscipes TaxID=488301 RepID=A0AAW1CR90_9HEMI
MAHGIKEDWRQGNKSPNVKNCIEKKGVIKSVREGKGIGSRRIFSPHFKLQVLDSYRNDADCRGNQRATARKYGIHRRQIQKWLQMESTLRCTAEQAPENGELMALNLAYSRQLDDSSSCIAEEELNVDKITDTEDDSSSISSSLYEQDQALDFTCAALSKRRFFSLSFKLEVIDAFYNDKLCYGNQRATARKFGIHRRQVQKWLNQETYLRSEATNECLDLSKKRKYENFDDESPVAKRTFIDLDVPEQPTSVQETALCLVKQPQIIPEVTSTVDLFRPYNLCCSLLETPTYDPWNSSSYCPYYNGIHTSCATKWLHEDAHYYKKAVNDISLYAPLYS